MSIRSIGIFMTGLAVLATTAYFAKKTFFQPAPTNSTLSTAQNNLGKSMHGIES